MPGSRKYIQVANKVKVVTVIAEHVGNSLKGKKHVGVQKNAPEKSADNKKWVNMKIWLSVSVVKFNKKHAVFLDRWSDSEKTKEEFGVW